MGLVLQNGVTERIRAHGVETYPNECCGAFYGRDGVVTATLALPNTTKEGPRRRFFIGPDDYRKADSLASSMGVELLGFYHSHPDHPAKPSPTDLENAMPSFSFIIVSIKEGVPEDMTSWRLLDDWSGFSQEDLTHA